MTLAEAKKYEREYNAETLTKDVAKNIINNYQSAMNNYAEGSAEYNEAKKSYDSWMKGAKLYYGNTFDPSTGGVDTSFIESAYKSTITSIDDNLKRTEEDIAKQRENAVKQAYSDYDRSLSTYGRNAEQLAQAGLGKSGYSDYLTGVAYGNMVGGIETANVTADEAVRNAYATADQLKLNAAQKRDEEIANAKKAYSDNVTALLSNVGTMDKATALEIAGNLGISTDDKARIERAYSDYANKAQGQATANILAQVGTVGTEVAVAQAKAIGLGEDAVSLIENAYGDYEKREAKATYDAFINNGGYLIDEYGNQYVPTEEQIAELARKAGYTPEDAEKGKTAVADTTYNNLKSQVTAETTDAEIDNATTDAATREKLKADRDALKVENVVAQFKADPKMGDDTTIDEEFEKGNLSPDAYQQMYFGKALSWIEGIDKVSEVEEGVAELDRLLFRKKISEKDYESLKEYLYNTAVTTIDNGKVNVEPALGTGEFKLTLGEDSYYVKTNLANNKVKEVLNKIVGDDNAAMIDGKLYIKVDGEWRYAKQTNYERHSTLQIQEAFESYAQSYGKIPAKPTHQQ